MSAAASTKPKRTSGLFWVGLFGALILAAVVAGRPSGEGTFLDPNNPKPAGAKGLRLLMEELGAEVDTTDDVPAGDQADVVLVLADVLDEAQVSQLARWTEDGGTLVMAAPVAGLAPPVSADVSLFPGVGTTLPPDTCTATALQDVGDIEVPGGLVYEVPPGSAQCYGDGANAFVVVTAVGDQGGAAVSLGGAGLWTNAELGNEHNAALAGALLVPEPGTRVVILEPPSAGQGDGDIWDVVGLGVPRALIQLAVAFVLFAWWRARRLGNPVVEPQPVPLEGSELVSAVGQLLQQNRTPQAAADLLRRDLRRTLAERIGVPPDAAPEVVASLVAQRTGLDPTEVAVALTPTPVTTEAALVDVAQQTEKIRAEVLHGRHP